MLTDMNTRKDIAPNNLREFRVKAGLTQKQVAAFLGLQWEDGLSLEKRSSYASYQKLS
jgi:transcriptional regulator with XRE-family HTH domain